MITRGHQQDLTLDPGTFSVDPDGYGLNESVSNNFIEHIFFIHFVIGKEWDYTYYCRIYGLYNFPNINGLLLSIDDPTIDPLNPSCFLNRSGI
jgi:hypothetical protein